MKDTQVGITIQLNKGCSSVRHALIRGIGIKPLFEEFTLNSLMIMTAGVSELTVQQGYFRENACLFLAGGYVATMAQVADSKFELMHRAVRWGFFRKR